MRNNAKLETAMEALEKHGSLEKATPRRMSPGRRVATLAAVVALLGLAGCSSIPDALNPVEWYQGASDTVGGWFSDDESESASNGNGAYPNLASVPDRPTPTTTEAERKELTSGLIADRANARYTEGTQPPSSGKSTAQGGAAALAAGASAAVASTPPSAAPPSVAPAPSASRPADRGRSPLWPNRQVPEGGTDRNVTSAKVGDHASVNANPVSTPIPKPRQEVARIEPTQQPSPPSPPAASATRYDSASQGAAAAPVTTAREPAASTPSDQTASVITDGPTLAQYERNLSGEVYLAGTVYFGHSSASLTDAERRMIAEIASAALDTNAMVQVVGHASSRTAEMSLADHEFANFSISLSRAEVVAGVLIDAGLPAERVLIEALSDSQPVYYESMPSGEAGNRRAEILLLY